MFCFEVMLIETYLMIVTYQLPYKLQYIRSLDKYLGHGLRQAWVESWVTAIEGKSIQTSSTCDCYGTHGEGSIFQLLNSVRRNNFLLP